MKKIQKRIWAYQTDLSGNVNGHFRTMELPIDSTEKDVIKEASRYYWKCFNVIDLGVVTSEIPDTRFCPEKIGSSFLKKVKKVKIARLLK